MPPFENLGVNYILNFGENLFVMPNLGSIKPSISQCFRHKPRGAIANPDI